MPKDDDLLRVFYSDGRQDERRKTLVFDKDLGVLYCVRRPGVWWCVGGCRLKARSPVMVMGA